MTLAIGKRVILSWTEMKMNREEKGVGGKCKISILERRTFRYPSGDTMWPVYEISAQKEDLNLKYKFRSNHYKDVILIHDN